MIINALGPIFLLIVFGAMLKWARFPGEGFWPGVERLTYFVLIPALLVHKLAFANFQGADISRIATAIIVVMMVMAILMVIFKPLLAGDGASFTSVFQGGLRFNSYLGLAIANELYGESGFVLAALTVAIMIPMSNLLCVSSFAVVSSGHRFRWKAFALSIAQNPLIIACALGIFLNLSDIGLPGWSDPTLAILSAAALPLGLLAVGVGMDFRAVPEASCEVMMASVVKFLVFPVFILVAVKLLSLDQLTQQVLMLFACLPTATSGYILARQLGGNTVLMANIITVQVLMAFLLMPVWISFSNFMLTVY